ncbi:MAG: hypothetical protein NT108_02320 [Candidatus Kaiserbacteria bacterium]|nr:hypothetical protein [Candidatus Kaiserbacteria bacterium]
MALFAHELRHGAYDMGAYLYFISLIELARKKGGPPIKFILFRHVLYRNFPEQSDSRMTRVNTEMAVLALWPSDEEAVQRDVLQCDDRWKKTTSWLCLVAVDGWHEPFLRHEWVKVCEPKKREKKPLDADAIRLKQERIRKTEYLCDLAKQRNVLWHKRQALLGWNETIRRHFLPVESRLEYALLSKRIERFERQIKCATSQQSWIDPKFLQPPLRRIPTGRLVLVSP